MKKKPWMLVAIGVLLGVPIVGQAYKAYDVAVALLVGVVWAAGIGALWRFGPLYGPPAE